MIIPMQSVSTTTNVVSSNPTQAIEVYSIQLYVMKFDRSPVTCYLLCMLPPLSGEPLLQCLTVAMITSKEWEICQVLDATKST